jgi:hypothetical protein
MRTASRAAKNGEYGKAFDIYNFVRKNCSSVEVSSKASLSLARILFLKMDNPADALRILEEAADKEIGPRWKESFSDLETRIRDSFGSATQGEIPVV